MNILGVELEFDFYDADQLEVYERASQKAVEQAKERSGCEKFEDAYLQLSGEEDAAWEPLVHY